MRTLTIGTGLVLALSLALVGCGGSEGEEGTDEPQKTSKKTTKKAPEGACRLFVDNHSDAPFRAAVDGESFEVPAWSAVERRPEPGERTLTVTRDGETLLKHSFTANPGKCFVADPTGTAKYHSFRIVYTNTPSFGNYDNDPRKYESAKFHEVTVAIDYGLGEEIASTIYMKGGFAARQALRKRVPKPMPPGLIARVLAADAEQMTHLYRVYSGSALWKMAVETGEKAKLPAARRAVFEVLSNPKDKRYRTAKSVLAKASDPAWAEDFTRWMRDRPLTRELVRPAVRWLPASEVARRFEGAAERLIGEVCTAASREPSEKRKELLIAALQQPKVSSYYLVTLVNVHDRKDPIVVDDALALALVAFVSRRPTPDANDLRLLQATLGQGEAMPASAAPVVLALLRKPPRSKEGDVVSLAARLPAEGIQQVVAGYASYPKAVRLQLIRMVGYRDRQKRYQDDVTFELLLLAAVDDADAVIQAEAYNTLLGNAKWLGRPATRPVVLKLLAMPASERPKGVRVSVSSIIYHADKMPPAERLKTLLGLLPDAGRSSQGQILKKLAGLPDPQRAEAEAAVRAIWDRLSSSNQGAAYELIAGEPRDEARLRTLLSDELPGVRYRAFRDLWRDSKKRDGALLDFLEKTAKAETDSATAKRMHTLIARALRTRDMHARAEASRAEAAKLKAEYDALRAIKDPTAKQRKLAYTRAITVTSRTYRSYYGSLMRRWLVPEDLKTLEKMYAKASDEGKQAIVGAVSSKMRADAKAHGLYKKALSDKSDKVRESIYRNGSWLARSDPKLKQLFLDALKREKNATLKARYSRYIK